MKYVIKSVPSNDTQALENLLNEMSAAGWDLYSMHEVEAAEEDNFQYNCIFVTDASSKETAEDEEIVNINTFKSQMEKMLSSSFSPYESCKEIQEKIAEQRKKIARIKTQLEAQSETPVSKNRKHLNDEISNGLKELENLRQNFLKIISPESMYSRVKQNKLSVSFSEEILDLVNPDLNAPLIAETVKIRQNIADKLGYVIPKIIFEDDENLLPYEFSIKIRGNEIFRGFAYPNCSMFYADEIQIDKKIKDSIQDIDKLSGKKIIWIEAKKTKNFWQNGLNASQYISKIIEKLAITYIDELFDYADVNKYMEIVSDKNMFLIENIIPDFVSVSELRYILVNLLREKVSIKDIIYVFEKLNDYAEDSSKEDILDKLRLCFSRTICKNISNDEGLISAFELSEKTYKALFAHINSDDDIVRIDGKKIEKITNSLVKKAKQNNIDTDSITVFAPLEARHMLFIILSQILPNVSVAAKEEITNDYTIEIIDEI